MISSPPWFFVAMRSPCGVKRSRLPIYAGRDKALRLERAAFHAALHAALGEAPGGRVEGAHAAFRRDARQRGAQRRRRERLAGRRFLGDGARLCLHLEAFVGRNRLGRLRVLSLLLTLALALPLALAELALAPVRGM